MAVSLLLIDRFMNGSVVIQRFLAEKLVEQRSKNPSYSLRAFAKRLDLAAPMLSEIMNGKRRVTRKTAKKICERLCVDPAKTREFVNAATNERLGLKKKLAQGSERLGQSQETDQANLVQLDMDHFRAISDWYHFAIISLAETADFVSDPVWIARRLDIKIREAEDAITRLERLGMLERDANGKLKATGVQYTTSDDIANLSLRRSHAQDLDLARESLENDDVSERDFTAVTMAIDPQKLREAKKMIRNFRDRLCAFLESGNKIEVYKMSFNLFPLTSPIVETSKQGDNEK